MRQIYLVWEFVPKTPLLWHGRYLKYNLHRQQLLILSFSKNLHGEFHFCCNNHSSTSPFKILPITWTFCGLLNSVFQNYSIQIFMVSYPLLCESTHSWSLLSSSGSYSSSSLERIRRCWCLLFLWASCVTGKICTSMLHPSATRWFST